MSGTGWKAVGTVAWADGETPGLVYFMDCPRGNSLPRSYSPGATKKDGRILVLAAAIITGLRLARDPRAGSKTERVIDAVEDGIFLANQIYEKALLRYGQENIDFKW